MSRHTPGWDEHLDAVEEWVRQVEAALATEGCVLPVAPTAPTGPLPAEFVLRTHTALMLVDDLITSAGRRRTELDRARAYTHA